MKRGVVLGFVVFVTAVCLAQEGSHKAEHRDCLVVAPFATEVKYAEFHGRDQLTYTVEEPYPATDVLAFISDGLRRQHWKPLQYDLWNPKIPSSHVSGWTAFDEATATPQQRVYQWMAQWKNDKHDVVSYVLQYSYAKEDVSKEPEHHMRTLHVRAMYLPARIADEVKRKQGPPPQK
jgi:hypothetical protein